MLQLIFSPFLAGMESEECSTVLGKMHGIQLKKKRKTFENI